MKTKDWCYSEVGTKSSDSSFHAVAHLAFQRVGINPDEHEVKYEDTYDPEYRDNVASATISVPI